MFREVTFDVEQELEDAVIKLADAMFGSSSIYVDVKKHVKGKKIISIPDGYVIDMADPDSPRMFVVENEISKHDAFNHIGIQMLRFVTSFDEAQNDVRNFLMEEIAKDEVALSKLEDACGNSAKRNIDNYLDEAVFGDFRGLVIIDHAREELHHVLEKINANISVLELKAYQADNGEMLYEFDTLYDEFEEEISSVEKEDPAAVRKLRRERRVRSDTIIVPAKKEGFERVFLGENQWYAIRIGAAMKDRIKYIAAYQIRPVSAVTHIAKVKEIRPHQDTGKYAVIFDGPAEEIPPIKLENSNNSPQGPVYAKRETLLSASKLEEALS